MSGAVPASLAQVEQWFQQAAAGTTAKPLQTWINAVRDDSSLRNSAFQLCLTILSSPQQDVTLRFYALTTISQWQPLQSPAEQDALAVVLAQQIEPNLLKEHAFFRNKVADVFVQLCLLGNHHPPPQSQQQQRQHVVQWVVHLQPPALFCKVVAILLETLLAENANARPAAVQLKQILRQSDSMDLQRDWLLQTLQYLRHSLEQNDAALAVLALQTCQAFLAFTDVSPVTVNPQLLLQALANQDASVALAALETWHEWAVSNNNVQLSDDSNLWQSVLQQVHTSNFLPYQGESDADIETVIAAARLINAIGLAHVEHMTTNNHETPVHTLWPAVWDLLQRAFAYDDIDVSAAVLPVVTQLVQTPTMTTQQLPRLLEILFRQMPYPTDFAYDFANDDICAEEEMYRIQLDKLYKRMVQKNSGLILQALQQQAQQVATAAMAIPQHVEALLRLIYHYVEGIKPTPGLPRVMESSAFRQLLIAVLHQSSLVHAQQHPQVLRIYFETAVRYYPLYQQSSPQQDEFLSQLLNSLTGDCGLQHSHAQLRSRCCYLLLRLVKALIVRFAPLVQSAVQGILALLRNPNLVLRPDDTLYLFETIGLLLGKTNLSAADQQTYLTQIMTPHVQSIERGLAAAQTVPSLRATPGSHCNPNGNAEESDSDDDDTVDPIGKSLAHSIAALTYLTKGFPKVPPEAVQVVFLETLNVTVRVLETLPSSEAVRSKSMTHLQSMIQSLMKNEQSRGHILSLVPRFLSPLIQYCTADDYTFVGQIFNRTCLKCKADAIPVLDGAFLPFFSKCQALMAAITTAVVTEATPHTDEHNMAFVPPHAAAEQLGVLKVTFVVVECIVTTEVTPLLLSAANAPHLRNVLTHVAQGAIQISEPSVRKTCLHILRELVDQWIVPLEQQQFCSVEVSRGLLSILYQTVLPGVLAAFVSSDFDERDAQKYRNVVDFSRLVHIMISKDDIDNVLTSLYATNAPSGSLEALRTSDDVKSVERLLMSRLSEWKGRSNNKRA